MLQSVNGAKRDSLRTNHLRHHLRSRHRVRSFQFRRIGCSLSLNAGRRELIGPMHCHQRPVFSSCRRHLSQPKLQFASWRFRAMRGIALNLRCPVGIFQATLSASSCRFRVQQPLALAGPMILRTEQRFWLPIWFCELFSFWPRGYFLG